MTSKIKHLSVNWIDGMKISKEHFLQQEFAFHDLIRDVYCQVININNYGLLPWLSKECPSLEMQISSEVIELSVCRGITMGGVRIEILPEIFSQPFTLSLANIRKDSGKMNRELLVVVAADYYSRTPTGEPLPEESPLRYPFTTPNYRLEAVPLEDLGSGAWMPNHLPVAKIRIESGFFRAMEHFIPPAMSMSSFDILRDHGHGWCKMLLDMEMVVLKIVQKIKSNHQSNRLADNLCQLAEGLLAFLAQHIDSYRQNWKYETPLFTILFFKKMARVFKVLLHCLPERENLLNYFSHWSEFSPVEFENTIDTLLDLEFNHMSLDDAISKVNGFTSMLHSLLQKLSGLNYIEQRTDEFFV